MDSNSIELKFCINCANAGADSDFTNYPDAIKCERPNLARNLVTGKVITLFAIVERQSVYATACGPEGKFYVKKETPG